MGKHKKWEKVYNIIKNMRFYLKIIQISKTASL